MKITNKSGLPLPIVRAVENDPYDSGDSDISATRLISPPQQVALAKTHDDELVEDAADRLWALIGQIGHHILERGTSSEDSEMVEKRLYATMSGWVVSGQFDLMQKAGEILDYKFTSVWSTKDGLKPEWEQQLNVYAWLCRLQQPAIPVNSLAIVAIYRDWSKSKARRGEVPSTQSETINVPIWPAEQAEQFVATRIARHQDAQAGNLPECSDSERWKTADRWAVMKQGNKRASKLCDSEAEAHRLAAADPKKYVEHRPGEAKRCQDYCIASPFCNQWANAPENPANG